ncbi:hypothetical protein HELRODRAFT_171398 [Helobdella robusta]|uniref:BRCT domain-containing protein n=1 Tax=Helobdella robusta TaxID=6412 RepID=T1F481_HELRO|nr:hypothetical protein HELRODRAFT_171398 [Helobdella robusta]ESO05730.1 hypothetical protein HELRODRAFT_171398 [Helobdella robusta]
MFLARQLSRHDNLLAWALVTVHGGKYTTRLNRTVTHLLTNISSGSKFMKASKVGLHVVCVQWLVVVIQEGKLITESDYHPDLFTCSSLATYDGESCKKDVDTSNNCNNTTSRQLESSESNLGIVPHSMSLTQLNTNRLLSSASTEVRNYPAQHKSLSSNSFIRKVPNKSCDWLPTTDHSHLPSIYRTHENPNDVKPENCLAGCCFFMEDCKKYLTDSEFNLWKQVIRQYQGKVMDDYADEVTHVLCETQDSPYFHKALTDKKRLVTSYWLNDCLSQHKLIVPCNCLHIPHMKPIEMICSNQIMIQFVQCDFKWQTLCITNFDGYERVLVKRMIVMLGAKYTGFLNRNNSLLVAKRASGKKYQKALEWNVPVVNARWISELMFGNLKALKQPLLPSLFSVTVKPRCSRDMLSSNFMKWSNISRQSRFGRDSPHKCLSPSWKTRAGRKCFRALLESVNPALLTADKSSSYMFYILNKTNKS